MFLDELKSVYSLKSAVLDLKNRFMLDAVPEYKAAHQKHAQEHDALLEDLGAEKSPSARDSQEQNERKRHYMEGLRHLAAVHRSLATNATDVPVPLDAVFKDYLYGNPFEEHKSGERRPGSRGPGM
jgi:hypothetical protein